MPGNALEDARTLGGTITAALIAWCVGLFVGRSTLAPSEVLGALAHPHATSDAITIVWSLRLPPSSARNPLVDPFLTGVSAGAGVAIAIAVALGVSATLVPAKRSSKNENLRRAQFGRALRDLGRLPAPDERRTRGHDRCFEFGKFGFERSFETAKIHGDGRGRRDATASHGRAVVR